MNQSGLAPVFAGLRTGLHVLFGALVLLVMVRAVLFDGDMAMLVVGIAIVFIVTYAVGGWFISQTNKYTGAWLALLSIEWVALVWTTPDAAYLVFPLFFLYLHLGRGWRGPVGVGLSTLLVILIIGFRHGFTTGTVIGPVIAAGVAIAFGLGYRALYHEATERERLIDELRHAQSQLSATERERGILDERTRLAGEIHDTVAQGLSSIQMLLHAAERSDPDSPGIEHVQLARETAARGLNEARRLVRELTPAPLVDSTLFAAIQRTSAETAATYGFDVEVHLDGEGRRLPMAIETALLRICQGVLGNVAEHAECNVTHVTLAYRQGEIDLTIVDDGVGFDPTSVHNQDAAGDSFGFDVMRHRVERLGGSLSIQSAEGRGTSVSVSIEVSS